MKTSSPRSAQTVLRALRELTLAVYERGTALAGRAGLMLADTKVEIGVADDGTLVLADEILTPDSSRFWPADRWEPGHAQPSYDKQFVRDWLVSSESGWTSRQRDAPAAPARRRGCRHPSAVCRGLRTAYRSTVRRLAPLTSCRSNGG